MSKINHASEPIKALVTSFKIIQPLNTVGTNDLFLEQFHKTSQKPKEFIQSC